jgi:hypothetical protein
MALDGGLFRYKRKKSPITTIYWGKPKFLNASGKNTAGRRILSVMLQPITAGDNMGA